MDIVLSKNDVKCAVFKISDVQNHFYFFLNQSHQITLSYYLYEVRKKKFNIYEGNKGCEYFKFL